MKTYLVRHPWNHFLGGWGVDGEMEGWGTSDWFLTRSLPSAIATCSNCQMFVWMWFISQVLSQQGYCLFITYVTSLFSEPLSRKNVLLSCWGHHWSRHLSCCTLCSHMWSGSYVLVISALVESLELICLECVNSSVGVSLFIWAQHQNASKFRWLFHLMTEMLSP